MNSPGCSAWRDLPAIRTRVHSFRYNTVFVSKRMYLLFYCVLCNCSCIFTFYIFLNFFFSLFLLCPAQGALSDDAVWRLSVWRLSPSFGRRAVCAAGWLDGAYWLIRPGLKRVVCWRSPRKLNGYSCNSNFVHRPIRIGYVICAHIEPFFPKYGWRGGPQSWLPRATCACGLDADTNVLHKSTCLIGQFEARSGY